MAPIERTVAIQGRVKGDPCELAMPLVVVTISL